MNLRRQRLVLLGLISFTFSIAQADTVKTADVFASIRLSHFKVTNVTVAEAAMLLAGKISVRMEIEALQCKGAPSAMIDKKISVDVRDVSASDVLDAITTSNRTFKWRIKKNGLVHVFPVACEKDAAYILNLVLPKYQARGINLSKSLTALVAQIRLKHPEFVVNAPVQNLTKDFYGQDIPLNILRNKVTVRDVLSVLAAKYNESWAMFMGKAVVGSRKDPIPYLLFGNPSENPRFNLPSHVTARSIVEFESGTTERTAWSWWKPGSDYDNSVFSMPIKRLAVKDLSVPDVLTVLANKFHFRYYIEAVPTQKTTSVDLLKPISINVSDVTLMEALDAITATDRTYRWSISNGLVTLYPLLSIGDKSYPLTKVLPSVKFSLIETEPALTALALQLSQANPQLPISNGVVEKHRDAQGDAILFNLVERNTTARKVLDRLSAKADDSWLILPTDEGKSLSILSGKQYFKKENERLTNAIEIEM